MLTVYTAVLQALGWKAQLIHLPGYRERALKAKLSTFLIPAEASESLFSEQGYWCWAQARERLEDFTECYWLSKAVVAPLHGA